MNDMVALLDKSPLPSKTALRARGATSSFDSRRAAAFKSSNRIELGGFTYDACRRLGSCSKDPIGYLDGPNVYSAHFVMNGTDPTGLVKILCGYSCMRDSGGMMGQQWREVECNGLGENCCRNMSLGDYCHPDGDWKIVPGRDATDEARDDLLSATFDIVSCCVPIGAAVSKARLCYTTTGRILMSKSPRHFILEYTTNGKTQYAHMPGWDWIGDPVSGKGASAYLKEALMRTWRFPLRYPERIPDTKCVKDCFWTVVSATIRGL